MGSLFFLVGAELGSATRDFATQNIVVTGSAQRGRAQMFTSSTPQRRSGMKWSDPVPATKPSNLPLNSQKSHLLEDRPPGPWVLWGYPPTNHLELVKL